MFREHVSMLVCPNCGAGLSSRSTEEWIENGELTCSGGHTYAVRGGAPRLIASTDAQSSDTLDSFNWQYSDEAILEYDLDRVRRRLEPTFGLNESMISGKRVCVIGCGNGPEVRVMLDLGAAFVAGIDLTDSIHVAAHLVASDRRALVVQADAQRPPLRPASFDLVYSDGVLAHVADPLRAMTAMADLLRPGGRMVVRTIFSGGGIRKWAHAAPRGAIRTVTSRLPNAVLWRVAGGFAFLGNLPVIGWLADRTFVFRNPDRRDRWATRLENFRRYGRHTYRHRLDPNSAIAAIRSHVPSAVSAFRNDVLDTRLSKATRRDTQPMMVCT